MHVTLQLQKNNKNNNKKRITDAIENVNETHIHNINENIFKIICRI